MWRVRPFPGGRRVAAGPAGGRRPPAGPALKVAGAIGLTAFLIAIFGCVVSLIVRFRRARQVERQQLKWLSYAAVLAGLAVLFQIVLTAVWGNTTLTTQLSNAAVTGSLVCVPVAVGIAVLR